MATHEHFGVYGAWLQDGRLVTVEKSRGPYTGWLDLPGGSPEPGETDVDALRRELDEECGASVSEVLAWSDFDVHLDRASDGTAIDFRHRGRIAFVSVEGPVAAVEDVEDVVRVVLLRAGDPRSVTPAVEWAWRSLAQQR